MIALKRILVPTDFSETSEAALRYGVELARRFVARLYLLHVPEHPGEAAAAEYPIGIFETMQNAAHDRLGHLLSEEETRDLRPECAMRLGVPWEEIWMRKYSSAGATLWTRGAAGTGANADRAYGVASDSSGNVVITGHVYDGATNDDLWLRKYYQ